MLTDELLVPKVQYRNNLLIHLHLIFLIGFIFFGQEQITIFGNSGKIDYRSTCKFYRGKNIKYHYEVLVTALN